MGEDRHAGVRLHAANEPFAAAGDDHVDMVRRRQHRADEGPVAGWRHLDSGLRQIRGFQPIDQTGVYCRSGVEAFRPAPQDRRVAGFQAQPARISGDIRAAFIDHADHAQRRAHPADVEARSHVPLFQHLTHRIDLIGHSPQPIRHAPNAVFSQEQPVHHRRRQALFAAIVHVQRIGGCDLVPPRPDGVGGGDKGGVLPLRRGVGEFLGRGFRPRADLGHHLPCIHLIAVHHSSPSVPKNHIIPMRHRGAARVAQGRLYLIRLQARDQARLIRHIS